MTSPTDTASEPRAPLSRERVLQTALHLADSEGLQAVTMRRLGQELGVEAMSLYNHVANKDDILRGIFEMVMNEIDVPSARSDWKATLRASALSAHNTWTRHPWAHSLMMSSSMAGSARMEWMESVLKTLRHAGFSAEETCPAYHALESHITGFTLWRANIPPAAELKGMAEKALQAISAEEYPYIVEHVEQHLVDPKPGDKSTFEFGLDLLLDGLERNLNTA